MKPSEDYFVVSSIGPWLATNLILFTSESSAIIFYSDRVEMKENAVNLPKIIKHAF